MRLSNFGSIIIICEIFLRNVTGICDSGRTKYCNINISHLILLPQVLEWLVSLVEGSDIEEVTDDMLEKMIITEDKLAVLFYEENDEVSSTILESMENIDDDLVRNQISHKTYAKTFKLLSK